MNIKRIIANIIALAMLCGALFALSSCGFLVLNEDPKKEEPKDTLTFAEYLAMSEDEQVAFFNTFSSIDAFKEWYNAAKDEYDKNSTNPGVSGSVSEGDKLPGDEGGNEGTSGGNEGSNQGGESGGNEQGGEPSKNPDGSENGGESGSNGGNEDENGNEAGGEQGGDGDNTDGNENGNEQGGNTGDNAGDSTGDDTDDGLLTYEEYEALSEAEQLEYYNSFATVDEFFTWFNEAKAKYDEEHKAADNDGNIDIGG